MDSRDPAARPSAHPPRDRRPVTLESAFGSVEPSTRTADLDRLIREAKDEKAARTLGQSRDA